MNASIEQKFVDTFVARDLRNRFKFELLGKKRDKALSRLSHDVDDILDHKYMTTISSQEELLNRLADTFKNLNFVSSYTIGGEHDGERLPALDAIKFSFETAVASVVILSQSLAFVKSETERGFSDKYLLCAEKCGKSSR